MAQIFFLIGFYIATYISSCPNEQFMKFSSESVIGKQNMVTIQTTKTFDRTSLLLKQITPETVSGLKLTEYQITNNYFMKIDHENKNSVIDLEKVNCSK